VENVVESLATWPKNLEDVKDETNKTISKELYTLDSLPSCMQNNMNEDLNTSQWKITLIATIFL
jgi:Mg2+ and Co2+ transporter CorA